MSLLAHAIRTVVNDCLVVARDERLTVVCDETTRELGELMRAQGEAAGADAGLEPMPQRELDGEEPPDDVAAAMAASDVVLAPTAKSLSHTRARRRASEAGVRIATLPGVTEEMVARTMSVDLREVGQLAVAIAGRLSDASEARITCEHGSDLRLQLGARRGIPDAGRLGAPGAFDNPPCGEGFIAPLEDRGGAPRRGRHHRRPREAGRAGTAGARGRQARIRLGRGRAAALAAHGGENVAELGVGCNGRARVTGNVLEDEKVLGTVHVAFGASASFGGAVQVPVHLDCVLLRPQLELDGELFVGGGRLRV